MAYLLFVLPIVGLLAIFGVALRHGQTDGRVKPNACSIPILLAKAEKEKGKKKAPMPPPMTNLYFLTKCCPAMTTTTG